MTPADLLRGTDVALIDSLRRCLDRAGYRAEEVARLLDLPQFAVAHVGPRERPGLLWRCGGDDPLSVLVRLFFLGAAVAPDVLGRAAAPEDPEAWTGLGVLRAGSSDLRARFQLVPFGPLVLAVDGPWSNVPRAERVMRVTNSTAALAQLMLTSPAGDALDLGTGSGVLALLAAGHAARVLATDASGRALAVAAFNARLNGRDAVSFRRGDWFGPVQGQQFDRVVCNPPFAMGPRREVLYRDSGAADDGLCERLVRELPRHLREGGFGQVAVNWTHPAGGDGADRLRAWVEGSGCDALVLRVETVTPDRYVTWWLPPAEEASAADFQARFDEWAAALRERGIEAVSYGLVTLRMRSGAANWFALEAAPERVGPCGADLEASFARHTLLQSGDDALLATRLRVGGGVRCEQAAVSQGGRWETAEARVRRPTGLAHAVAVNLDLLTLVSACNGDHPLGVVLRGALLNLGGRTPEQVAALLRSVRELVAFGLLEPVP